MQMQTTSGVGRARFVRAGAALLASVVAALAMPASVEAQLKVWTAAVNGNWSEDGNWSPIGEPTLDDDLLFDLGLGDTLPAQLGLDELAGDIFIEDAQVFSGGSLTIGSGGGINLTNGFLRISGSSLSTDIFRTTGTGTVVIDDTGFEGGAFVATNGLGVISNTGGVELATYDVFSDNTVLQVNTSLRLSGVTNTIAGLTGGGVVNISSTGTRLILAGAQNNTFTGQVVGGPESLLQKAGGGTQTFTNLTGMGGAVLVTGGTFNYAETATIGGLSATVEVEGGTFRTNRPLRAEIYLLNGGTIAFEGGSSETAGLSVNVGGGTLDASANAVYTLGQLGGFSTDASTVLSKTGAGSIKSVQPSNFAGVLDVQEGTFELAEEGGLGSVAAINIAEGGAFRVTLDRTASQLISGNAAVNLGGGDLVFETAGYTQNLKRLNAERGSSSLQLLNGLGSVLLEVDDLSLNPSATLDVVGDRLGGTQRLVVRDRPGADFAGPRLTANGQNWLRYDGGEGFVPFEAQDYTLNSFAGENEDVLIGTNVPLAGSANVRSVRFSADGLQTIDGGGLLNVSSGGLLKTGPGDTRVNIGLRASGVPLIAHINQGRFLAEGFVEGDGLIKAGLGELVVSDGTIGGPVAVNRGVLRTKAPQTLFFGDLLVDGGTLIQETPDSFEARRDATVRSGLYDLDADQNFGNVELQGGTLLVRPTARLVADQIRHVGGDLVVNGQVQTTLVEFGGVEQDVVNLNGSLGIGGARTFRLLDGSLRVEGNGLIDFGNTGTASFEVSEGPSPDDLVINAAVTANNVSKSGFGTLVLGNQANSFVEVEVSQGVLELRPTVANTVVIPGDLNVTGGQLSLARGGGQSFSTDTRIGLNAGSVTVPDLYGSPLVAQSLTLEGGQFQLGTDNELTVKQLNVSGGFNLIRPASTLRTDELSFTDGDSFVAIVLSEANDAGRLVVRDRIFVDVNGTAELQPVISSFAAGTKAEADFDRGVIDLDGGVVEFDVRPNQNATQLAVGATLTGGRARQVGGGTTAYLVPADTTFGLTLAEGQSLVTTSNGLGGQEILIDGATTRLALRNDDEQSPLDLPNDLRATNAANPVVIEVNRDSAGPATAFQLQDVTVGSQLELQGQGVLTIQSLSLLDDVMFLNDARLVIDGPVRDDASRKFDKGFDTDGVFSDGGSTRFGGGVEENTYSGDTDITGGELELAKEADTVAVPGNMNVSGTGVVTNFNDEQIDDAAEVSVAEDGLWDLNGFIETVAKVTVTGNGTVDTGTGQVATQTLEVGTDSTTKRGGERDDSPLLGSVQLIGGAPQLTVFERSVLIDATIASTSAVLVGGGGEVTFSGRADVQGMTVDGASVTFEAGLVQASGGVLTGEWNVLNGGALNIPSSSAGAGPVSDIAGLLRLEGVGSTFTPFAAVDTVSGRLEVTGGARLSGGAILNEGEIVVGPDGSLRLTSLTNAGLIELIGGDMAAGQIVIDYTGDSPLTVLEAQIRAGQIFATGAPNSAVGYVEAVRLFGDAGGTWFGETVDATTLLIAYTFGGDANLNGTIDIDDFNLLAEYFGQAGRTWYEGDFNGDGRVGLEDFNLLATNYGIVVRTEPTPADWDTLRAAIVEASVPEPASAGWLAVAVALLRRRRAVPVTTRP